MTVAVVGGDETWSGPKCILEGESTGLTDGLDARCEKGESGMMPMICSLKNQKDGVAIE